MGLVDDIAARLRTHRFGRPLHGFDTTTSTMDEARALVAGERALGNAPPFGAVIVAGEQTSGRGRLGRPFVSPAGGLYLTVILAPPGEPSDAWRCGFAAALAARDAIAAAGGPDVEFDWPNDLVLGDRKVGGILLELQAPPPGDRSPAVLLLGIGLNVGPDPRALDARSAGPAGRITGFAGDPRAAVAAELLLGLEELVPLCRDGEGWRTVIDGVRAVSRAARGGAVTVRDPQGDVIEGQGIGIDEDGTLRVRLADVTERAVRYGERVYDVR